MDHSVAEVMSALQAAREAVNLAEARLLQISRAQPSTPKLTLTVNEACEALQISRSTFYRLAETNQIKTVSLGSRKFVPVAELNKLLGQAA